MLKNVRGTLAYVTLDNLGGNVSLGLAEGLNAAYYCRLCKCSIEECQEMTVEQSERIWTKSNYQALLEVIAQLEKIEHAETKGLKRYCTLNDLNYFHMTQNVSVPN